MTSEDPILYREALRGGQMWSRVVRRGQALKLIDVEGGASVAALLYNAAQPLERYNMADTLKAQHTAFLTAGCALYSDMGRVLMSITDDSAGWHDTFTGHLDRAGSEAKYGRGSYQALRNEWFRNTRDNFLIELGKHGLGARDIVPNLNLFVKVTVSADGTLAFQSERRAGRSVSLRAEMDTLIVLSNTPHPLEPGSSYAPKPVELLLQKAAPERADDPCRTRCAENARGFTLTEDYTR